MTATTIAPPRPVPTWMPLTIAALLLTWWIAAFIGAGVRVSPGARKPPPQDNTGGSSVTSTTTTTTSE